MARGCTRHSGVQSSATQKNPAWHAGCNMQGAKALTRMTASHQHHVRLAGACFTQRQQRCAVMPMRPVVISVWYKKTGAGNQN
jgi:hypothetical protein